MRPVEIYGCRVPHPHLVGEDLEELGVETTGKPVLLGRLSIAGRRNVGRHANFADEPGDIAGPFQHEIEICLFERREQGVIGLVEAPEGIPVLLDLLLGEAPQRQFPRGRHVPERELVVALEVEVGGVPAARGIVEQLVEGLFTVLEELLQRIAEGVDRLLSNLPVPFRSPGEGRNGSDGQAGESRERKHPAPRGSHKQ